MTCPKCGETLDDGAVFCSDCGWSRSVIGDAGNGETKFVAESGVVLGGRFRLLCRLGKGGMGEVWLAEDTSALGDKVAIKVLKDDLVSDKNALDAMRDEVRIAKRLSHPNIVRIHDLHEQGNSPFISMEYVDGETLQAVGRKRGRIPWSELLPWARQMADALDYAHTRKVLHRDIKPANMLLGRDGTVKLADFGIARIAQDAETRLTGKVSSGTLLYMSPEQHANERGKRDDSRSDLYSFAATLYELISGAPPFSSGDVAYQIHSKEPDPVEDVPARVNAALLKGLSKDQNLRQRTCAELVDELSGEKSPAGSRTTKRAVPGWKIAALAVVCCVAAGFFMLILQHHRVPTPTPPINVTAMSAGARPKPPIKVTGALASAAGAPAKPEPVPAPCPAPPGPRPEPSSVAPVAPAPTPTPSPAPTPAPPPRAPVPTPSPAPTPAPPPGPKPFEVNFGFYRANDQLITDGSVLHSGDQFRIEFESSRDCYVYIFNQGGSGTVDVLYPRKDIDTKAFITRGKKIRLPNDDYDYRVDSVTGKEEMTLIASLEPLEKLDRVVKEATGTQITTRDISVVEGEVTTRGVGVSKRVAKTTAGLEIEKIQGNGSLVRTIAFQHQ